MKRIYLDHNATTPLHPQVFDEMKPYFSQHYGNPSSIHRYGQKARRAVDRARRRVAALIGAEPSEIVFTSGGTEANNLAIRGALRAVRGNHIVTSAIEHPAVLETCRDLEQLKAAKVTYLEVDRYGLLDPQRVSSALTRETGLVAVMLANNDVGTIQPVQQVVEAARSSACLVFSDAVQAAGKIPLDAYCLGVDLLSLSAHKLYGPKGVGALYVRRGTPLEPIFGGGAHESGLRPGTENVPAIVGFGCACELVRADLEAEAARVGALRDRLQEAIFALSDEVQLNGHPQLRLPNTLNLSFPSMDGESLLINLDLLGVAISTGSACSSGTVKPSHVLTAMGQQEAAAHGAIRFSLGRSTTEAEIDQAIAMLKEVLISAGYRQ